MYCSGCGIELKKEVNFCHDCGTKVLAASYNNMGDKPKKTVRSDHETVRLSGDETYAVCSCKKHNENDLVVGKQENLQDNPIFWFLVIGSILITILTSGVALGPILGILIYTLLFPTYRCEACGAKIPKKNFR